MTDEFRMDSGKIAVANERARTVLDAMEKDLQDLKEAKQQYQNQMEDEVSRQASEIMETISKQINQLREILAEKFHLYDDIVWLVRIIEEGGIQE